MSDGSVFLCTVSIHHSYLQPIRNIFVLCFVLDDNSPGDYVTQLFKAVKTAVDSKRSTTDRTVGTAVDIGNDTVEERSTTDRTVGTALDIGNDTVDERSTTDRTVGTALDIGNDTVDERSTTDRTVNMSATKEGTTWKIHQVKVHNYVRGHEARHSFSVKHDTVRKQMLIF